MLPGRYPDRQYDYWRLWQRIVPRSFLGLRWWGKKGEPFWLDTNGFYEVRISLKDAAWTYWKENAS